MRRQLDYLVGKEIMGYRWWRSAEGCLLTLVHLNPDKWTQIDRPGDSDTIIQDADLYGCPRFSTDIRSAWRVVERMRERGFDALVNSGPTGVTPPGWDGPCRACFNNYVPEIPDIDEHYWSHSCESFPEAICVAALKACGVAVEEEVCA